VRKAGRDRRQKPFEWVHPVCGWRSGSRCPAKSGPQWVGPFLPYLEGGRLMERRTLIWWSTGAASFVAAQLALRENPEAVIVRCETNNEDPDNYRFEADAMRRLNASVTLLKSGEYESVWDVWQKRRYMGGINGAPCTSEMKVAPRLAFQRPGDVHVFGYTADREDVERFERRKCTYFELLGRAPLIEHGITK